MFCTHTSPFSSWTLTILLNLYPNLCHCLCLHQVPHSFFLNPTILPPPLSPSRHLAASEPISRQSLMHYRYSHQSWFCFTAEKSRLSFWLHINCSVGTWTRIVKYSSVFFSLVLLSPHSLFPLPYHGPPSLVLLRRPHIYPLIFTFYLTSPFYLYILFLVSFLSLAQSRPLLRHHISL